MPMWPRRRRRIAGSTARAVLIGPHNMTSIASAKSSRSNAVKAPTWMTPATHIRTSIGPISPSTVATTSSTCSARDTSSTMVCTVMPSRAS